MNDRNVDRRLAQPPPQQRPFRPVRHRLRRRSADPKALLSSFHLGKSAFAMKIYTRTGDDGSTSLLVGGRVSKTDPRIAASGALDELNCAIGVARAASPSPSADAALATIQRHLFELGADLAETGKRPPTKRISPSATTWMENEIDRMVTELPPLKNFILPGGGETASQIHLARAVCRRAEREVVGLAQSEVVDASALVFLNRLSDFLFILARHENFLGGVSEEKWSE
jgi:cob(I)alamin adenosyltransferase